MRRLLAIVGLVVVSLIVLATAAVLVATNTAFGRERIRRVAVGMLNKKLRGRVQIGRVSGNLLRGLTLDDIAITDRAGNPFLTASRVHADYSLGTLIRKRIELDNLLLDRPVIVLDQPPGSEWNFVRILPASTTPRDTARGFGSWISLRNAAILEGHVIVRTPWKPPDSLGARVRDSVVRAALDGTGRQRVERVPTGYQSVMELDQLTASLPRVRLADPDTVTRLLQIEALHAVAAVYRPPVAVVRDLHGTFLLSADSLWFNGARIDLPGTRLVGTGRYALASGDLRLMAQLPQLSLADLRFAYPRLPSDGHGTLGLDVAMHPRGTSTIRVRDARLTIGNASLAGTVGLEMGDTLRIRDTDLQLSGVDTRLLEQMVPNLKVPVRGALAGRLALDGTLSAMRVDADLTFASPRAGTSRLVAMGVAGTEGGTRLRARDLRVRVAPLQVALLRAVRPSLPVAGTITGAARMDGSLARGMHLDATMEHRDHGAITRLSARGSAALGAPRRVDMELGLTPLSLATAGQFMPALGLTGNAAGRVGIHGTLADLDLRADLTTPDGGGLLARGRVDLDHPVPGYDMVLGLHVFDVRAVTSRGPHTALSATAGVRGRGLDVHTMRAVVSADLARSEIDSIAFDAVRLRTTIADGVARVDTVLVRTSFGQVAASGSVALAPTQNGELTFSMGVDSLGALQRWMQPDTTPVRLRPAVRAELLARARADSARRASAAQVEATATGRPAATVTLDTALLHRDTLAGAVYASGVITGHVGDLSVRGRVGTTKLLARGNAIRAGMMEVAARGVGSPTPAFAAAGAFDTLAAGGFAFDRLELHTAYMAPNGILDLRVLQDTSRVEYRVQSEVAINPNERTVRLRDVRLRLDSTVWALAHPAAVHWGGAGIAIDSVDLRNGPRGRLYVNGDLPRTGPMRMDVQVSGLQIADVVRLLQGNMAARGIVELRAGLAGTQRAPVLNGALGMVGLSFRGTALPDVRTSVAYANERLDAQLDLRRGDEPPLATASAQVPVNLAMSGVTGSRILDRPLRLDFVADSLPLDVLPRVTDAVANVRGRVVGAVSARGTGVHPVLAGMLGLDLANFTIVPMGITLSRIGGLVHMAGNTIVIDSLLGFSDSGPVSVRGKVDVANSTSPHLDLRLTAKNALLLDNDVGRLYANIDSIAVLGALDTLTIRGQGRILNGVIYIPQASNQVALATTDPAVASLVDTTSKSQRALAQTSSPILEHMRVDLQLGIARDTWVRNSAANVEIFSSGPLRIHMDRMRDSSISVQGVVNTERGEYTFLGRTFNLQQGTVTFTGGRELDPLLQLTAEYDVQLASREALHINILVGGTMRQPKVTLSSDAQPPIAQTDLLSYLAFGRSSSSLLQQESSGLSSQSAGSGDLVGDAAALATRQLAAVAVGTLAQQWQADAQRSLSADVFRITPADMPTEVSLTGVTSVLEGTQVEAGKYLDRRTFVALQVRASLVAPGLRVERRLSRGFRLEASIEPRYLLREPTLSEGQSNDPVTSFGAFLVKEWRF